MATIITNMEIETLSAKLPQAIRNSCSAIYNDNIYVFGGFNTKGKINTIYKFNCTNKTIERLSVTLPQVLANACCARYNNYIYIFGGANVSEQQRTIYRFDCINETITTLSVTLPQPRDEFCCSIYEDKIYIFGGYGYGSSNSTIYRFDCTNETITTLSVNLPSSISLMCCSTKNDNIYIFGGMISGSSSNKIYKFNCTNETITTLSVTLPQPLYGSCCSIYADNIYIFGGVNNSTLNTIYSFNCNNETIELLSISLPEQIRYGCCNTYENNIYLIGGSYNLNKNIYDFSLIVETYNIKYDISSNDGSKQYVELLDNTPIKAITFNNVTDTNIVEYIFETLSGTLQGSFEIDKIENKHLAGFSTIINATSIQIPLNKRVELDISIDTNFYTVYTTYRPLANTFKLELYNNTSEDNRVDKTNYLTKVGELSGVLREESSLVDMSLTLELEELPLFNYVYIAQLNRYYYVTDIVSVKYKLWTISLSVDVLMSYKNALLSCSAFVDRNENSYDNTIIDKKRVIQQGYDIEVSTVTNQLLDNTSTNNIVLTGFYVKSV